MSAQPPPRLRGLVLTERLGSGSHAIVYQGYSKTNSREVVAVKCISKKSLTQSSTENLLTEIEILKSVHHPHIVELKDFQWDHENIYLIMEFCGGGDLSRFIRSRRRLPEKVVRNFLQQLASALHLLYERKISHLDLKPQNILLTSSSHPTLKVADFGFAQYMLLEDDCRSLRGSPLYMAPEMVCRGQYDAKADLWSVGIILYDWDSLFLRRTRKGLGAGRGEIHTSGTRHVLSSASTNNKTIKNILVEKAIFGEAPFASRSFTELEEKIKSNRPIELPLGVHVSPACRDLLQRLLVRDPEQRISFEEFFSHPFLDLEHMPSANSLEMAVSLVTEAVQKDQNGDLQAALTFYCKSLEFFIPALQYETDCRRKEAVRSKVKQYIARAEELKVMLRSNFQESCVQACTSREILLEMSKDKPRLHKALQLAQQTVTLEENGAEPVLHLYQEALGELILMLAAEEEGRRKQLIHLEIQNLMSRAERIKQDNKMRESKDTALEVGELSDSVRTGCTIQ